MNIFKHNKSVHSLTLTCGYSVVDVRFCFVEFAKQFEVLEFEPQGWASELLDHLYVHPVPLARFRLPPLHVHIRQRPLPLKHERHVRCGWCDSIHVW